MRGRNRQDMNIINTNVLTSNQYHDAKSLVQLCRQADGSRGISFLEPETNYITEYPCFFMMYEGDTLVSFASVFIPDESTCEIYADTLPSARGKGYFNRILKMIKEKNKDFNIEKTYMVNDPTCIVGTKAMEAIGARLESSDYLMRYNNEVKPVPKHILTLRIEKEGDNEKYISMKEDMEIGHCYVEYTRETAFIFDFFIYEKHRGMGYGTETLQLLLEHLLKHGCNKILLHVNNANKAAHKMYYHHGFIHDEQLDYWRL